MKKILFALLSIGLALSIIACGNQKGSNTEESSQNNSDISTSIEKDKIRDGYDFRKGNWGDSQSTIEGREGKLIFTAAENPDEYDLLSGEATINDCQAAFSYAFKDDKLKCGIYNIISDLETRDQYLGAFNSFFADFTDKYGSPAAKGIIPYNYEIPRNAAQNDQYASMQVGTIEAKNYAIFESDTSDIILSLAIEPNVDGYGAEFIIVYAESDYYDGASGNDISDDTSNNTRSICDFRNAKWGDTRSDILKYEPDLNIVDENEDTIMASGTVSGYNAAILYSFDDDGKLRVAGYGLDLNYTNPGQYIPVYDILKDKLSEKYGEAVGGITQLADQQLIDMVSEGQALQFGYVTYTHMWQTDTTGIMLMMYAEDFEITLMIRYMDLNYESDLGNEL